MRYVVLFFLVVVVVLVGYGWLVDVESIGLLDL